MTFLKLICWFRELHDFLKIDIWLHELCDFLKLIYWLHELYDFLKLIYWILMDTLMIFLRNCLLFGVLVYFLYFFFTAFKLVFCVNIFSLASCFQCILEKLVYTQFSHYMKNANQGTRIFPRWNFPRRTFSRRTFSRRNFPRPGFSPPEFSPPGLFPAYPEIHILKSALSYTN